MHQSVKILVSLMQFPALTDPQVPDEILSPKLVNWRQILGCGDPTKSLPHGEKCQWWLIFSAWRYFALIVLLIICKAAFCAWASVFPSVKQRGCIR